MYVEKRSVRMKKFNHDAVLLVKVLVYMCDGDANGLVPDMGQAVRWPNRSP